MPYVPRSAVETFNLGWQKSIAWAETQGIGPSSYMPVYQLDLTRLKNGEYPMSAGERNREILATYTPRNVTPAPGTSPSAGNVISNLANTAKNLFLGLLRAPEELWHSAGQTIRAIEHPASLNARSIGGTIGNWLNDTLLAFLPGASDIGTVLQHDPNLSGDQGFIALADHPLSSLLDMIPFGDGGGILGAIARKGVLGPEAADWAARMAAEGSIPRQIVNKLGSIPTGKAGVTATGGLTEHLTVAQRLENLAARLGPGGAGVGPAIGAVAGYVSQMQTMGGDLYNWLFDDTTRAMANLTPEQDAIMRQILDTRRVDNGSAVVKAMADPGVPVVVKEAIRAQLTGPLRFAVEEALFQGDIRPVETLSGERMVYARPRVDSIDQAWRARDAAERKAVEKMTALEPHVSKLERLDKMLPAATAQFQERLMAARTAVGQDAGLLGNITQERAVPEKLFGQTVRARRGISKDAQVQAVVAEGGLADQFLARVRDAHDPAEVKALAEAMRSRLSRWGARSVDAAQAGASSPALMALDQTLDSFTQWATEYQAEAKSIDRSIYGEREKYQVLKATHTREARTAQEAMKARQRVERENLKATFTQSSAQAAARYGRRITQMADTRAFLTQQIIDDAEARAKLATKAVLDKEIMPRVNRELDTIDTRTRYNMQAARREWRLETAERKAKYQRDLERMRRRHHEEAVALGRAISKMKATDSAFLHDLEDYADQVDGYRQAIFDHPATEFRDAMLVLYEEQLKRHEMAATLIAQTERYVSKTAKQERAAAELARLHADPALLGNYIAFRFRDIFNDPRLDPEVRDQAARAADECWEAADAELKTMIAQGYRVQYIPASDATDVLLGRDAIKPLIGRKPGVDMAKSRAWDYTARTGDAAIGINKAVVEALRRDVTIEFAEHYLKPFAMSRKDIMDFVERQHGVGFPGLPGGIEVGFQQAIADLGVTPVEGDFFGPVKVPSWTRDQMYLPTPIYKAVTQLMHERKPLGAGFTKLFKYSVLGLSPRYDAHILFGATTMLALRSGPRLFTFLPEAWRMVRDGAMPEEMLHAAATEEGFEQAAFRMWHEAGGRKLGAEAVAEHIEQVQGIPRAAATVVHKLKAMADINFRFTRFVRDLQMSLAYLTAFTKASRVDGRVEVEMAETGRAAAMTARRAMHEALHHVQEVYGNLQTMSPFERRVAQSLVPFYGWQRHMIGYVLSFPIDHPYRAVILSQAAERATQDIPAGYPIRDIALYFFLGSPGASGDVNAIDIRSLDPFRTAANYFSLTGWLASINPALLAPVAMVDPSIIYGENALYPQLTYTAFYGIETAPPQGNAMTGPEQIVPQLGAVTSALSSVTSVRSLWATDRSAAIKEMLSSLEIPFVTPPVNLKQLAARDEGARYEAAKTAAYNAFQTGTFKALDGFRVVPNPLNPDYTITPRALETLYTLARQQYPTLAPIEALTPPPSPYGF